MAMPLIKLVILLKCFLCNGHNLQIFCCVIELFSQSVFYVVHLKIQIEGFLSYYLMLLVIFKAERCVQYIK